MSSGMKRFKVSRLEDVTLGAFAFAPASETVDHAVRYLGTWDGADKVFMLIQYSLKLIIPFLHFRARMQQKTGMSKDIASPAAVSLNKLYSLICDSRMLYRFTGLLSIYQWLTSLERMRPPTRSLLSIERLQGWSMLAYYPLEHLYYLRANALLPAAISLPLALPFFKSSPSINLNINKLALWSTRFWALYTFLQFVHLREDYGLLKLRERALGKASKGKAKASTVTEEKVELRKRWDALANELVVNLGYLPLTIHWSLEKGLFSNDIWVGIFGLIAGIASFRNGWKMTARPASQQPVIPHSEEDEKADFDTGSASMAGGDFSNSQPRPEEADVQVGGSLVVVN